MRLPESANRTVLAGRVLERGAIRHTPSGVPVIEFRIAHQSEQIEAGAVRRVECEMACVALGPTALMLREVASGADLRLAGFLAAKSLRQKTPVLHVTQAEFVENFE